ncbi:MAG TPA: PKD domain-containing protein [Candidatus Thermoplasmatota archaeon]|nr:PKD domain-containing protein [Candidatus Thermoplasmatota archaeon]
MSARRFASVVTLAMILPLALPLVPTALAVTASPPGPTLPGFAVFAAPSGAFHGGEPTVGINWQTDAMMYHSATTTYKVVANLAASPPTASWTDVSPPNSIENIDPMLFTDVGTGRTFAGGLDGECSIMSFTENDGADWTPVGNMCAGAIDHQSIGQGAWKEPRPIGATYDRATYYCAQGWVSFPQNACATSLDGGLTFLPPVMWDGNCFGLHGHVNVSTVTGTAFVPTRTCGGKAGMGWSDDNGATWHDKQIAPTNSPSNGFDPSIGVASGGRVWFAYESSSWLPYVAYSDDDGANFNILGTNIGADKGIQTATFMRAIAGDNDRIAVAYLGSTTDGNPFVANWPGVWDLYVSFSYDSGATWETVKVTSDPVQRGWMCSAGLSCNSGRNLLDFMGSTLDATGHVIVGFPDGCIGACASAFGTASQSTNNWPTIARQVTGKGLFAAYDPVSISLAPLTGTAGSPATLAGTATLSQPYSLVINWGDGSTQTVSSLTDAALSVAHTYLAAGTYTVTVDGTGASGDEASGSTSATISGGQGPGSSVLIDEPAAHETVGAAVHVVGRVVGDGSNLPPTAAFSFVVSGSSVAFDGTGSSDPESGALAYAWAFGDAATGAGATASHAYATPGTYDVCLTVADVGGLTDDACASVTIQGQASVDTIAEDAEGDEAANSLSGSNVPAMDILKLEITKNAAQEPVFILTLKDLQTDPPVTEAANGIYWAVDWRSPDNAHSYVQYSVTTTGAEPTVTCVYGIITVTQGQNIQENEGTTTCSTTLGPNGKLYLTYPSAGLEAHGFEADSTLGNVVGAAGTVLEVPEAASGFFAYDTTSAADHQLHAGVAPWQLIGSQPAHVAKAAPATPPANPQIVDKVSDPVGDNSPVGNIQSAWFDADPDNLYVGMKVADIPADSTATAFTYYSVNFQPAYEVDDPQWGATGTVTGLRVTALYSPVAFDSLPSVPHTEDATSFELQVLSINPTTGASNFGTLGVVTGTVDPNSDIIWWVVPRTLLQSPPGGALLDTTSAASAPAIAGAVTFGGALADTTGTGDAYSFPSVVVTPPTVTLSATPAAGAAPLSVTFAPTVTPASMATWNLDFGDGTPDATGTTSFPVLSHVYEGEGSYHAVLTVTAPNGGVGTGATDVTVGSTELPPVRVTVAAGNLPAVDAICVASCSDWSADLDLGSLPDGEVTLTATLLVNGNVVDTDATVVELATATSAITIDAPASGATIDVGTTLDVAGRIVGSTNLPPQASLAGDVGSGLAPLDVTFTLGGDDDSGIAGWRFSSGDGRIVDGTAILPLEIQHTYQTPGTYHPSFRVTDTNGVQATSTGQVVVQAENRLPTTPASPVPADAAANVPVGATLSWVSTDPDATPLTADVYLDAVDGTTLVASDQTGAYMPVGLLPSTTYFWHVDVSDGIATVAGPTWSFTTAAPVLTEAQKPHVVVALIDTGTNPYHTQFTRAGLVEDPSTYITGLASSQLKEVDLCFYDAATKTVDRTRCPSGFTSAWQQDVANGRWAGFGVSPLSAIGAGQGKVAWFPGTNMMVVSFAHDPSVAPVGVDTGVGLPLDAGDAHGSWTSSNVGGLTTGTCPECIVVMIEADSVDAISAGYRWAANQPWIDVITSSTSVGLVGAGWNPGDFFDTNSQAAKTTVTRGGLMFESSGNGVANAGVAPTSTYLYGNSNPWTIAVGCSADGTGQPCGYSDFPNPITASGDARMSASPASMSGTEPVGGTSFSSPSAAGVTARALYGIRAAVGDTGEGAKATATHSLVRIPSGYTLPARGPLANGELTRLELEEALFKTARRGIVPKVPTYLTPNSEIPQSPVSFVKEGYGDVYRGDWGVGHASAEATWASTGDIVSHILTPPATGAVWPNRFIEETWWETVVEPTQIALFGGDVPDTDGNDGFPMNAAGAQGGLQGYAGPAFGVSAHVPAITDANADVPVGVVPSASANRIYLHHANLGPDPADPVNDLIEFYMNTIVDPAGGTDCSGTEGCADQSGLGGTGGGTAAATQVYELSYPRLDGISLLDRSKDALVHIDATGFAGAPASPLTLHVALKTGESLVLAGDVTRSGTGTYELRGKPLVDSVSDPVTLTIGWDGPVYSFHVNSQGASYLDLPIQATLPPTDAVPVKYYVDDISTFTTNGGSVFLTRDATKVAGDADKVTFFPFPQVGGVKLNLASDDALAASQGVLADAGEAHIYICTSSTSQGGSPRVPPGGAAQYTAALALTIGNIPVGGGSVTTTIGGTDSSTNFIPLTIPLTLHTALFPADAPVTGTLTLNGPGGVFTENMGVCGGGGAHPWSIEFAYHELAAPTATIDAPGGALKGIATLTGTASFPAAPAAADVKWFAQDFDGWDTQVDSFTMDTGGPGAASGGPLFEPTPGGYVLTFKSARPVAQDAPRLSSAGVASAHFWVLGVPAAPDVTVDFSILLENAQGGQRLLGSGSETKHVMSELGAVAPFAESEYVVSFTPAILEPAADERLVMIVRVHHATIDATTTGVSSFGGDEAEPIYVSLPKDVSAAPTAQAIDLVIGPLAKTVPVTNGAWSTTIDTAQLANGQHAARATPHADYAGVVRSGIAALRGVTVSNTQGTLNTPPVADLTIPGASGAAPLRVVAQIAGSDAQTPAGQLAWRLDWGDGSAPASGTGVPATAVHTYGVANAVARLTVTDLGGEIGSDTAPVSAFEAPPVRRVLVSLGDGDLIDAVDEAGDGSFSTWSASVPANVAGDLELVAQELRGSDVRSTMTIPLHVIVPELPDVRILSPADGAVVAPGTLLSGTVSYETGPVESVVVYTATGPGVLATSGDGFATWSANVDDLGLTEDWPSYVHAVATSATGNGEAAVSLTLNAAPNAEIRAPFAPLAMSDASFEAVYVPSATEAPVASYAWSFGDGGTSTDANPTHVFAHSGTYELLLTVTDTNGASGSAASFVYVLNNAPIVTLDVDVAEPTVQDTVTFTSTADDIDGTIESLRISVYDAQEELLAEGGDSLSLSFPDDGTYLVVARATDNEGAESLSSMRIWVLNLRPVAALTAAPTLVGTGQDVTLDASGSSDPDGAIAEYRFDPGDGTGVSIWSQPVVAHTYAIAGTFLATVTVVDDDGSDATSDAVQIVVNAAPILDAIGNKIVGEAEALGFTVTASDAEGDPLTFSADALPAGATFDTATGEFAWTPDFGTEGNYVVTFGVTDGLSSDSEPIYISVGNVDRPPVLAGVGDKLGAENALLTFALAATDPDAADTLRYTATGLPQGASLGELTGVFSWTPSYTQANDYTVTFTVSDGEITDSETVTLAIANVDRAPVLQAIGATSVKQLATVSIPLTATDADGDAITFTAEGAPGLSVEDRGAGHGVLHFTPPLVTPGPYVITVYALSGESFAAQSTVITVLFKTDFTVSGVGTTFLSASPGETVSLHARIANTGPQTDTFALDLGLTSSLWKHTDLPPTITLEPGQVADLDVDVSVPPTQPVTFTTITATSLGDGTTARTLRFRIDVPVIVTLAEMGHLSNAVDVPRGVVRVTHLDGTPAVAALVTVSQMPPALGGSFRTSATGSTNSSGDFAFDLSQDPRAMTPGEHQLVITAKKVGGLETTLVTRYFVGRAPI